MGRTGKRRRRRGETCVDLGILATNTLVGTVVDIPGHVGPGKTEGKEAPVSLMPGWPKECGD